MSIEAGLALLDYVFKKRFCGVCVRFTCFCYLGYVGRGLNFDFVLFVCIFSWLLLVWLSLLVQSIG